MKLNSFLRVLFGLFLELGFYGALTLEDEFPISELNTYFESFFAKKNSTDYETWLDSLPKQEELDEMRQLLAKVYRMETFKDVDNSLLDQYTALKDYLNVTVIQGHYCVIHEQIPQDSDRFRRMWGYVVIASKNWARRMIHHSASHFASDGPVCSQAAALFERTRSRSLVVAGADRFAVKGDKRSECQEQFQIADASHNCRTMFHFVNTVLKDLAEEDVQSSWKEDYHFFVQWHGMAETSCVHSDAFISTGIKNSSIYERSIPATKIMESFNRIAADLGMKVNATTPLQDQECTLTAGTNIFGRYINGVPRESVCNVTAKEEDITGKFVHIEQKRAIRENISLWTSVIQDAFPDRNGDSYSKSTALVMAFAVLCSFVF
ncbi:unnamed protein product [Cylicocyclus nassatus]|uniref:Uncharacterized protein n=1 Tax=Cylicocyclus nassatus TaxID=53992 RepID=A0AA36M9P2_CYLNA|nr:unnamed protein product [Cylicocyclus nassatus]